MDQNQAPVVEALAKIEAHPVIGFGVPGHGSAMPRGMRSLVGGRAYEDCAGRVAAEIIAPSPPGVPRVVPGHRIGPALRDWLVANRAAGMFVLDPTDPAERRIRVVRPEADPASRPALFRAET